MTASPLSGRSPKDRRSAASSGFGKSSGGEGCLSLWCRWARLESGIGWAGDSQGQRRVGGRLTAQRPARRPGRRRYPAPAHPTPRAIGPAASPPGDGVDHQGRIGLRIVIGQFHHGNPRGPGCGTEGAEPAGDGAASTAITHLCALVRRVSRASPDVTKSLDCAAMAALSGGCHPHPATYR